jgi:hypothetical protein
MQLASSGFVPASRCKVALSKLKDEYLETQENKFWGLNKAIR